VLIVLPHGPSFLPGFVVVPVIVVVPGGVLQWWEPLVRMLPDRRWPRLRGTKA
jgi:hypothetical protein